MEAQPLHPAAAELPPPVRRYLQRAGRGFSSRVWLRQRGELRTSPSSSRWMAFEATQEARADRPEFLWRARVRLGGALSLEVVDRLADGVGSGEVRFLRMRIGADAGTPEMNAGSLHRYLAEALWYPEALWPSARLSWEPLTESSAQATLRDGATAVSLEFRFASSGDVESIYTPARWGKFGRRYRALPWEGHFRDYVRRDGRRVPREAEVGWYVDGSYGCVWRGRIDVAG